MVLALLPCPWPAKVSLPSSPALSPPGRLKVADRDSSVRGRGAPRGALRSGGTGAAADTACGESLHADRLLEVTGLGCIQWWLSSGAEINT